MSIVDVVDGMSIGLASEVSLVPMTFTVPPPEMECGERGNVVVPRHETGTTDFESTGVQIGSAISKARDIESAVCYAESASSLCDGSRAEIRDIGIIAIDESAAVRDLQQSSSDVQHTSSCGIHASGTAEHVVSARECERAAIEVICSRSSLVADVQSGVAGQADIHSAVVLCEDACPPEVSHA